MKFGSFFLGMESNLQDTIKYMDARNDSTVIQKDLLLTTQTYYPNSNMKKFRA
jgi:hypothetical protein